MEQTDQKHQEDLQRLKNFRLLDDDFLTKVFCLIYEISNGRI